MTFTTVSLETLEGTVVGDGPVTSDGLSFDVSNVSAGSYLLSVNVGDALGDEYASPWWYGDTPYRSRAQVITVTDHDLDGLDLTMPMAGAFAGTVHAAAGGAVPFGYVQAFLRDPDTGTLAPVSSAWTDSAGDYRVAYLPEGSYVVQFSQYSSNRIPDYGDIYYGDTNDLAAAQLVDVTSGQTTDSIEGTLSPWVQLPADRIMGDSRYDTSAAVSQAGFAPGVDAVYVASGESWPDALSAGPAAAHRNAPLLLVASDGIPASVRTELNRLQPHEIVIVGGTSSVSAAVESDLGSLAPSVRRIGGANRYETSRNLSIDAFGHDVDSRTIYVATGTNFPDALSAGAVAAAARAPVALIDGSAAHLDAPTRLFLDASYRELYAVGGPLSVSDQLVDELGFFTKWGGASRIGGSDRYDVNRNLNAGGEFTPPGLQHTAYLVSGATFPDALSATALAGSHGARVFLAQPDCVPQATVDTMRGLHIDHVVLVGGTATLSDNVASLRPC
jgi:putative cell wall-binding protein